MVSKEALSEAINNMLEQLWVLKSMRQPSTRLPIFASTCPFCLESKIANGMLICDGCEYAKTHESCHEEESAWCRMRDALIKASEDPGFKNPFGERDQLAVDMAICKAEVAISKKNLTLDQFMTAKRDFLKEYFKHLPYCGTAVEALDEYW